MPKINEYVERLYREAVKAMKNAIVPYSGFRVGAALLTTEHKVYTGCNIENPSLMLSECAEKVAILKAVSDGVKDVRAIMIVSGMEGYCYPCGSCRQIIYEFAICGWQEGHKKICYRRAIAPCF